jgi:hypothetical protein
MLPEMMITMLVKNAIDPLPEELISTVWDEPATISSKPASPMG